MMAVNLWWIDVKSKGALNNTPPLTTVETGDKHYPYAFHDMMKDLTTWYTIKTTMYSSSTIYIQYSKNGDEQSNIGSVLEMSLHRDKRPVGFCHTVIVRI